MCGEIHMTYQRVTFTWPKWGVEQYLSGIKNKSAHSWEMFQKGSEYEISGGMSSKSQLIILSKEIKSKDELIKKQALEIGRLKALTDKKVEKSRLKRRMALNRTAHEALLDTILGDN